MSRAHRRAWIVVALLAMVAIGAVAGVIGPDLVQTWLYDNRPSGVACGDLPTGAEAEAALAAHPDLVRRIEGLGDDVDVYVDEPCDDHPGAAEIAVTYPGGDLRERIEALLAEESFGVPTSLRNV